MYMQKKGNAQQGRENGENGENGKIFFLSAMFRNGLALFFPRIRCSETGLGSTLFVNEWTAIRSLGLPSALALAAV
jgi:hypothetical protein